MKTRILLPVAGWMAAVAAAVTLAVAGPRESVMLGRVPTLATKSLDQRTLKFPQELPAARTLAVVVFASHQRHDARSWIEGLRLRDQGGIAWVKLPVIDDPGHAHGREAILDRLLARDRPSGERERMVPLFVDRAEFARATGLTAEFASILVLDREGNVLARAEGAYDEAKAQALRETLMAQAL
ncbi:hypothetical protein [Ramlibacter sp.]|uniref:hypothetical protein n=1 Tax=Ramlibacter sp. TaxID=1917967 RepID=UPI003D097EA4